VWKPVLSSGNLSELQLQFLRANSDAFNMLLNEEDHINNNTTHNNMTSSRNLSDKSASASRIANATRKSVLSSSSSTTNDIAGPRRIRSSRHRSVPDQQPSTAGGVTSAAAAATEGPAAPTSSLICIKAMMSDDDDDDDDDGRHVPTSSSSFISSSFEASYPVVIALSTTTSSSSSITNDNIITPLIDGSHAADDDDGRHDKDTSMLSLFTIPLEWLETIDTIITESASSSSSSLPKRDGQALKVMVIGSKGSGKSSFVRVATNRYLSTTIADHHHHHKDSCPPLVRVVDLDCGQPDVALPGTICIDLCHEVRLYPGPTSVIHNPTTTTAAGAAGAAGAASTTHQRQQQQQLYTGACTPALNPRDYVDKCCRLMDEAMRRDKGHEGSSSSPPVLVNTPGWYGGLGGHILAYLRYYIQPHIVIVLGDEQHQQEHNHYWSDLCN
ncbi:Polynucleotide 5'-hydroxyl-kinase nol9, partial [Perkinsus olseni]